MKMYDQITEIFCNVDDFCLEFEKEIHSYLLEQEKKRKNRPFSMADSEVITIMVYFHLGSFRNFKHFYLYYVKTHLQKEFPKAVSYNRFVELMQKSLLPMILFLKMSRMGECTGISFVDSTTLRVCNNRRIHNHRVFKGIAERGKGSMGWFYGFKLHLVVNDKGEIISFVITQGNVDDRDPLTNSNMLNKVKGKLFGDRGYLSQPLFDLLFVDGIHLITKIRSNMKNSLMSLEDKVMLRKRALIESINDELKNICQIEHSRHRSFPNFIVNLISSLVAYSFFPKKPAIQYQTVNPDQLMLF